jgi:hypothetical protein
LKSITNRELLLLTTLYNFEKKYPIKNEENEFQRTSRFWNEFTIDVSKKLFIKNENIEFVLQKLERTGLYSRFYGYLSDQTNMGKTTSFFNSFLSIITTDE